MKMNRIVSTILILALLTALLAACSSGPYVEPTTVEVPELVLNARSAVLAVGESVTVGYTGGEDVSFASSDPQIASVDGSGNVKALKKGNAMITVTSGEQTAKFGVMVEPSGEMIDLTSTQAAEVFSDVQLYHQHEIIDFSADGENGAFYMSQQYGGEKMPSDTIITKVSQVEGVWQRSEFVHLYNHGFGFFSIEKDENGNTYLLSESNGVFTNQGSTISRVKWESGVMYDEQFGDTYRLPGLEGSPRPESDAQGDVIVVYEFCGRESNFTVYDRSALLSGEENNYLHRFACASRQTPVNGKDDSNGRYNSAIRGFAVKDGYIYQLSGSGHIYISVFDFEGNLQYCHEVMEYQDLPKRMPGGISFSGDELYIAVNSATSTVVNYVNVWKLEEAAQ